MFNAIRRALLLACFTLPSAQALELQPGLWEFQITVQGGLMGNQVMSQQQCIQESDLDPSMFTTSMGPCSVDDMSDDARGLNWSFSCNLQGMTTSGTGTMTAVGDTVRGSVDMTMANSSSVASRTSTTSTSKQSVFPDI